jgi:hypothetical protein
VPCSIHTSPDTDSVTDVVSTVSEGSSAGSDDLDEGVEEFDLVLILRSMRVHAIHATTFRGTENADLSLMDVIVDTIGEGNDNHGRETNAEGLEVVSFVHGASTIRVAVENAHSPAERTTSLAEFSMMSGAGLLEEDAILLLGIEITNALILNGGKRWSSIAGHSTTCTSNVSRLLNVNTLGRNNVSIALLLADVIRRGIVHILDFRNLFVVITTVLHDSIVGDTSLVSVGRWWASEQERTHWDMPDSESVILLDDTSVDVGNEEEGRQQEETPANTESDGGDVPRGLLVEAELRRTLVNDGKGADRASNQEEEWGGPDSPWDGIGTHVHNRLDEHEDDSGKAGSDGRCHTKTSKDSTETLPIIPAPLDVACTDSSNTDTGNGRNQGVSR